MTKKELIEALNAFDDDKEVLVCGDDINVHYEVTDVDLGYDEDLEKDCIILYS